MKKIEELEWFFCYILHFQTFFIEKFKDQKPAHIGIQTLEAVPPEVFLWKAILKIWSKVKGEHPC